MPKKRKVTHRPPSPHPSVMAGKKNGNRPPPTHSPSSTGDEKKKRKLPPPLCPIPPQATVKKKEKRPSPPPPPPRRSSRSTKKEQAPLPSPSGSSSHSSSEEEESRTPGTLMEKNLGGSTADVPPHRTVPTSNSSGSEEDEEEGSESEESNEEESSIDSDAVPAASASASVKSNPLSQLQASELLHGKKPSNSIGSSDSGSEDSREGSEEATSSSESEQLPPSQLKTTEKDRGKETAAIMPGSIIIYGEGHDSMDNAVKASPPQKRCFQITAYSKSVESPDQPADKSNEAMKQMTPSPASTVQKNRKASDDGEEAGEEKKVLFKRVWSMADEVLLLRAILDHKEGHHIIPSTTEQLVPILNSTKDSLSISATLNQMYDKIRRMKIKYRNIAKRVNVNRNLHNLNAHDAIIFDLSRKIWGSNIKQHITHLQKTNAEEDKQSVRDIGEEKQFHEEYPSLYRLLKSEYPKFAIPVPLSDIPISEARDLDENCKKLESMEIQLLMERQTSLGDVFKLFKMAHAKNG